MKMDTMNISLPASMADYVRRTVERDYGNSSEYFRDLVRERIEKETLADVSFLNDATLGAPVGPSGDEVSEILKIQKQVRKGIRARRA
jgi:Arc/MetJ-type ribon-helix-helix transcriptional regulator